MSFTRDIHRAYEIATILIRYGFGDIVRRLGMSKVLMEAGKLLNWQSLDENMRLSAPDRLRRVLEELGTTFVKVGQIMATRVDLFPPELIAELEKLQSSTRPVDFEVFRPRLEADLGCPLEEVFSEFETTPGGSASIAQVHFAKLKDGTPVVVKLRKPGIRSRVEADLRLIGHMAMLAEKELLDLKVYRPRAMAEQFSNSLLSELDLEEESRHADRARRHLDEEKSNLIIPKVYWEYTNERMNVQERIVGIKGFDVEGLRKTGGDPVAIAKDGAHTVSKMIVEDGFFHADPHPGNVFYLNDNRYALIDWGMVGRLTELRRNQLIDLLMGMVRRDTDAVRDILVDWCEDEDAVDQERLMIYIEEFLDKYHSVPIDKMDMASTFYDLTRLLRDNRISLPPDLALVFKVFITLEGLGRRLNPEFDLATEARPVLERTMRRRYHPSELFRRGKKVVQETFDIMVGLPKDIQSITRSLKAGRVKVNVEVQGLDSFGQRIDDAATRLASSLVTAAFILSTSIVMSVGKSPVVYGIPFFDILGYGAMIGGLFVLFSILRANRQRHKKKK